MKKFLLGFLLISAFAFNTQVQAQCIPDTQTVVGIYPDTLLDGCEGEYYTDTLTFVFPDDTTITVPPFGSLTIPFDSFVVGSVTMIPAGLTYECNVPSCTYIPPGGGAPAKGCVSLTGTPTTAGVVTDSIEVEGIAWVTILGSPTSFTEIIRMGLWIHPAGSAGCATAVNNKAARELNLQVFPNPVDASTQVSFNLFSGADVSVTLMDAAGRTVQNMYNGDLGVGKHSFNLNHSLPSGMYYLRVNVNSGEFTSSVKVVSIR